MVRHVYPSCEELKNLHNINVVMINLYFIYSIHMYIYIYIYTVYVTDLHITGISR